MLLLIILLQITNHSESPPTYGYSPTITINQSTKSGYIVNSPQSPWGLVLTKMGTHLFSPISPSSSPRTEVPHTLLSRGGRGYRGARQPRIIPGHVNKVETPLFTTIFHIIFIGFPPFLN
jgi:hypothetical protein